MRSVASSSGERGGARGGSGGGLSPDAELLPSWLLFSLLLSLLVGGAVVVVVVVVVGGGGGGGGGGGRCWLVSNQPAANQILRSCSKNSPPSASHAKSSRRCAAMVFDIALLGGDMTIGKGGWRRWPSPASPFTALAAQRICTQPALHAFEFVY